MKESMNNIAMVCADCSNERLQEWQSNNKNTIIRVNDHVKLGFPSTEPKSRLEWMWVQVKSIKEDKIEGILDNDPIFPHNIKCGDPVIFERESICQHLPHDQ